MMLFTRRKGARVEQGSLSTLIDRNVVIERFDQSIAVRFDKSMRFDGRLRGSLIGTVKKNCTLVIGPEAIVEGNVLANSVIVLGIVRGNVSGEYVEVRDNARVDGDITYVRVEIHQGSRVQGRLFRVEDDGERKEETGKGVGEIPGPTEGA